MSEEQKRRISNHVKIIYIIIKNEKNIIHMCFYDKMVNLIEKIKIKERFVNWSYLKKLFLNHYSSRIYLSFLLIFFGVIIINSVQNHVWGSILIGTGFELIINCIFVYFEKSDKKNEKRKRFRDKILRQITRANWSDNFSTEDKRQLLEELDYLMYMENIDTELFKDTEEIIFFIGEIANKFIFTRQVKFVVEKLLKILDYSFSKSYSESSIFYLHNFKPTFENNIPKIIFAFYSHSLSKRDNTLSECVLRFSYKLIGDLIKFSGNSQHCMGDQRLSKNFVKLFASITRRSIAEGGVSSIETTLEIDGKTYIMYDYKLGQEIGLKGLNLLNNFALKYTRKDLLDLIKKYNKELNDYKNLIYRNKNNVWKNK